jgi:hypothetical protein
VQTRGDLARADRIGFAALRDLPGHFGGLDQDLLERLDLFDGQGAGLGLKTFDAVGGGLRRAHHLINGALRLDEAQVGRGGRL